MVITTKSITSISSFTVDELHWHIVVIAKTIALGSRSVPIQTIDSVESFGENGKTKTKIPPNVGCEISGWSGCYHVNNKTTETSITDVVVTNQIGRRY